MIKAILATDEDGGIARNGVMPWPKNNDDLRLFSQKTRGQTVVMGSSTWQAKDMLSPLPGRNNIVITSDWSQLEPGFDAAYGGDINKVLPVIVERWSPDPNQDTWLIGGANLIHGALHLIEEMHITRIQGIYDCDKFLNQENIDIYFDLSYIESINETTFLEVYKRKA